MRSLKWVSTVSKGLPYPMCFGEAQAAIKKPQYAGVAQSVEQPTIQECVCMTLTAMQ